MERTEYDEIFAKARKYDALTARLLPLSEKLTEASQLLSQVSEELFPKIPKQVGVAGRKTTARIQEIEEELYEAMKMKHLKVTTDLIEQMYPDFDKNKAQYIKKKLAKMRGVQTTLTNGKTFLWIPEE